MKAETDSQPRIPRWRIGAWVISGVVVVGTLIVYVRRAVVAIESGDVERGLITLVVLAVGFTALSVVSVFGVVWLNRRKRIERESLGREE